MSKDKIVDTNLINFYNSIPNKVTNMITRFPPEPNGYLHIGHAKAIYVNFELAKMTNGFCYLRFDDTNPKKEKIEYIDSIIDDVKWLGYNPDKITFTSNYFDQLIKYAYDLISKDLAYICELDSNTIKAQRNTKTDSPYRNRSIDESKKLFSQMIEGVIPENTMTLRLKADMQSNNPNMRDPVIYRVIISDPHPKTGTKYKVYPTYDYSHCIVDSIEGITHSLCSIEFQTKNEVYVWILDKLELRKPIQIEYSKLNITDTVLSKRKLIKLVEDKTVESWSSCELPTLKGLCNKGYTQNSIKSFISKLGVSVGRASMTNTNLDILEECVRQDLNEKAPRVLAIVKPLLVNIINLKENKIIIVKDFPFQKDSCTHEITISPNIFIEQDDFREIDSSDYFRLAPPEKIVRLKYFGLVKYVSHTKDDNQNINFVNVILLPDDYKPKNRVKGTINWIDCNNCVPIVINKYDKLVDKEGNINNNCKSVVNVLADTSLMNRKMGTSVQFEKLGYMHINDYSNNVMTVNMIASIMNGL